MNESYFKDLSGIKVMPKEQVESEIRKYQTGDLNALNRVIEGNLRLVVHIANKYAKIIEGHDTLSLDDLISEGNIGLIEAAQKYNPDIHVSFTFYASIWIKKQIIASLLNNLHIIRSPWNKLKADGKIRKSIQILEQEVSREISEDEIRKLGIYKEDEIKHFFHKATTERIPDYFDFEEGEEQDNSEQIQRLHTALKFLSPREQEVITQVFGIDTNKKSLTQIGEEQNTSKQSIWQIKERALQKIKEKLG